MTALHTDISSLQERIEEIWEKVMRPTPVSGLLQESSTKSAIDAALALLQEGKVRVAEKEILETPQISQWKTNQWLKKAILLSFRVYPNECFQNGPLMPSRGASSWYDKIALKFSNWNEKDFEQAQLRVVPGSIVRYSAYIAPDCVIMPSFINVGAHIGKGTMVDTWATIGSCAQIGENCHISGGTGIGGVLEPLQSNPVIIENNCFIGARSEIAEGVVVEEGSVISMGTFISASTRIIDRQSGTIYYGRVPPYSVVIPGSMPSATASLEGNALSPSLACVVIVKQVDAKTRSKTAINDLLRL